MSKFSVHLLILLLFIVTPLVSSAQFSQIQKIPSQVDRADAYGGGQALEAANGDILVFVIEFGEFTDLSSFPYVGTPANLWVTRSSDAGGTWSIPSIIRTGIDQFGTQGMSNHHVTVLPSGRIVLNYFYQTAAFPNYAKTSEIMHSDDDGVTWTLAANKDTDTYGLISTEDGTLFTLDNVVNLSTGDEIHTRISSDDGVTWSESQLITTDFSFCGQNLSVDEDAGDLLYTYSDCYFGFGGTVNTYQIQSADDGATWSDPLLLTSGGSGFGASPSHVILPDASRWLVYADGPAIAFRTSDDDGSTWSDVTTWTAGTTTLWDFGPNCSASSYGPLCTFGAARTSQYPQIYLGVPGLSVDPLFGSVAAEEDDELPASFRLDQNYPNPFNPTTNINFDVSEISNVTLTLHDVLGRELRVLSSGIRNPGSHSVTLNAASLASGIYIYRLQVDGEIFSRQMTLLR